MLGAQARTSWAITGAGAKSLPTQGVFHKIVEDTILQNDDTVTIANMRNAIRSTNVTHNEAITPGVIPSSMVILMNPIAGFSNDLTEASVNMKFGLNTNLEYQGASTFKLASESHITDPGEPPGESSQRLRLRHCP